MPNTVTRVSLTFVSQILLAVSSLLLQIYWARQVPANEIGVYYKFVLMTDVVFVATTLSVDQAVVQSGFTIERHRAALWILYGTVALASLVGAFVVVALSTLDATLSSHAVIGYASILGGALLALANYAIVRRFSDGRIHEIMFWRLGIYVLAAGISAGAIVWWPSAGGMVLRDVVFAGGCLVIFLVIERPVLMPAWDKAEISRLVGFCSRSWVVNLVSRLSLRSDYLLIGQAAQSNGAFGMYSQLRSVAEGALSLITYQVQTILFVRFVRGANIDGALSRRLFAILIIAVASLVGAALALEQITASVFAAVLGTHWTVASRWLPGLILTCAGIMVFEVTLAFFKARAKHSTIIWPHVLRIGLTIAMLSLPWSRFELDVVVWVVGVSLFSASILVPGVAWVRSKSRGASPNG